LDGREPRTVTEYEYEGGRIVRAIATREPEWLPVDRAEMLALAEFRGSLCPGGCGHPVDETTAHHEKGPQYEAHSTTCRACAERREAQDGKAESNPDASAQLWFVTKVR
jgi:hypothetical protein